MKKIGILGVCMMLLVGCAKTQQVVQEEIKMSTEEETTKEEITGEKTTVSEETGEDISDVQNKEETIMEEKKVPNRSKTFALLSEMNIGWNLGNTLDAYGVKGGTGDETAWGNPVTTKEMIDAVAAQGFNTIRIPVTWSDHMGDAPAYEIDEVWMARVKEVVQYAIDNDMYVILDTHHEPNDWLIPSVEKQEQVAQQLEAVWTQIAQAFAAYDEKLLFEGMNEPRVIGSAKEWNGGTLEERRVVNALNQVFIDTVRKTGGKNADRCLIICTYGNCAERSAIQDLTIPEDENIAVAIHMYTPYDFTFSASQNSISVWDGSRKKDITGTLTLINDLLLKDGNGVPVIITEFGAENKNNTQEVVKWAGDYLDAMNSYGIKCVWWDNNIYEQNGEKFGIFNRSDCSWYTPDVVKALIEKTKG